MTRELQRVVAWLFFMLSARFHHTTMWALRGIVALLSCWMLGTAGLRRHGPWQGSCAGTQAPRRTLLFNTPVVKEHPMRGEMLKKVSSQTDSLSLQVAWLKQFVSERPAVEVGRRRGVPVECTQDGAEGSPDRS